jgi:hypothetical protein
MGPTLRCWRQELRCLVDAIRLQIVGCVVPGGQYNHHFYQVLQESLNESKEEIHRFEELHYRETKTRRYKTARGTSSLDKGDATSNGP